MHYLGEFGSWVSISKPPTIEEGVLEELPCHAQRTEYFVSITSLGCKRVAGEERQLGSALTIYLDRLREREEKRANSELDESDEEL